MGKTLVTIPLLDIVMNFTELLPILFNYEKPRVVAVGFPSDNLIVTK